MAFHSINCNGRLVDLSLPKIMGILNITPDSFSDGGKYTTEYSAMKQAEKMIIQGADFIDIGGQSTRPTSEKVSAKEEIIRLGSLISLLKKEFPQILISLDTFYGEVVRFGYNEGIDLVNDISAGQFCPELLSIVSETGLPYVLMYINPTYEAMHQTTTKGNIILEINKFFSEKVSHLKKLGIKDILFDPGFGFGKTIPQQEQMIQELEYLGFGDEPLLIGISRKSFIYKPLGKTPLEIEEETEQLHLKCLEKGAKILRVHNVEKTKQTIDFYLNRRKI